MYRALVTAGLLLVGLTPASAEPEALGRREAQWLAQAAAPGPAERRAAAFALGKLGLDAGPRVVPALAKLLADADTSVRSNAARALGEIAGQLGKGAAPDWPLCGDRLAAAVADTQPAVRQAALAALGAFGETAAPALEVIRKALADPDAEVRRNATFAVGAIGFVEGEVVAELAERLTDADALVRRDAVTALAELHRIEANRPKLADAGPALVRMLREEIGPEGKPRDAVVLATALEKVLALRALPLEKLGPTLVPVLRGEDEELSRLAAFALAAAGGDDAGLALPVLRRALRADEATPQELAAAGLAQLGPLAEPALLELAAALRPDRAAKVRRNAAIALGRLGPKARPALNHLIETIQAAPKTADEEAVRLYAVEAVALVGHPNNAEALPVLAELIRTEKDSQLRLRAVWSFLGCEALQEKWAEALVDLLREPGGTDPAGARLEAARVLAGALKHRSPLVVIEVLYEGLLAEGTFRFDGTGTRVLAGSEQGVGSTVAENVTDPDARHMYARGLALVGKRVLDFPAKDKLKADLEAAKVERNRPKLNDEAAKALKAIWN